MLGVSAVLSSLTKLEICWVNLLPARYGCALYVRRVVKTNEEGPLLCFVLYFSQIFFSLVVSFLPLLFAEFCKVSGCIYFGDSISLLQGLDSFV